MAWIGLCYLFHHDFAISGKLKWTKTREALLVSSKWKTYLSGRRLKDLSFLSLAIVSVMSNLTVISKHITALKKDI